MTIIGGTDYPASYLATFCSIGLLLWLDVVDLAVVHTNRYVFQDGSCEVPH